MVGFNFLYTTLPGSNGSLENKLRGELELISKGGEKYIEVKDDENTINGEDKICLHSSRPTKKIKEERCWIHCI